MKFVLIILLFFPLVTFSQLKDSVVVYHGNGSFEEDIIDLSNQNLLKLPVIDRDVEILILDNNNLKEIPDWFVNLKQLRSLSIRNNKLVDVSVLGFCENLEEIYLSNNHNLYDLPSFSFCKKLKIVDVTNTKINELPISIRGMDGIAYFKYSIAKKN
ncbi:leucine-rich repeat domain-containing protein [Labilibacter sediminis]|nr:leucine-rich repeat domain-containing protein [Labilibacter sediminis]